MLQRLARIFSIPAGEERATFLLFAMYLMFFAGLTYSNFAKHIGQVMVQHRWHRRWVCSTC